FSVIGSQHIDSVGNHSQRGFFGVLVHLRAPRSSGSLAPIISQPKRRDESSESAPRIGFSRRTGNIFRDNGLLTSAFAGEIHRAAMLSALPGRSAGFKPLRNSVSRRICPPSCPAALKTCCIKVAMKLLPIDFPRNFLSSLGNERHAS